METHKPTCVLADDHPLMLEILGIRVEAAGMKVIGETTDGAAAIKLVSDLRPDVAIVDLGIPHVSGIDIVSAVAEMDSPTKTLLFSGDDNPNMVKRAIDAGANGYLNKASGQEMLVCALNTIRAGGCFIDPTVASKLLEPENFSLSPREIEVLSLMTDGLQNKVIACRLEVSEETIKTHVSSLMTKLGVNSRTGAVGIALRTALVA